MTDATRGLRAALTRGASGNVIALAEMEADDILAGLSDEQKTALGAKLSAGPAPEAPAPAAKGDAEPDPADENEPGEGEDPEDKRNDGMPDGEAAAHASERARVKAVAKAVAEDETCKGKAELALAMLADDDFAGLNAAAMVKMIGKQQVASDADPDAAARAEMKDAIRSASNSNVDAGGAPQKGKGESSAALWDAAIEANNPRRKSA